MHMHTHFIDYEFIIYPWGQVHKHVIRKYPPPLVKLINGDVTWMQQMYAFVSKMKIFEHMEI